jgi:hypothetical protein
VDIPNSVTIIEDGAFKNCKGLRSFIIPNTITDIKRETFSGCTGLKNIVIPNSVKSIGFSAFSECTGLETVIIGDSVTFIDESAFSGCTGLTNLTIGKSVDTFYSNAFYDCNLKDVYCYIQQSFPGYVYIGENAFANSELSYEHRTLHVRHGSLWEYQYSDWEPYFGSIVEMGGVGDIDGDGKVSIKDTSILIDYLLMGDDATYYSGSADVNGDGNVSISDVIALIDQLLSSNN